MTIPYIARYVAGVILAVALSGCGPQMTLTDSCAAEGYQYGTREMNNCVGQKQQALMSLMSNLQSQQAAQQAVQQANYQQQMQFYQRPVYQNPTVNCSSNRMGSMVSTTCY